MDFEKITKLWPMFVAVVTVSGAAYLSVYRLNKAEAAIASLESVVAKNRESTAEAINGIRNSLGDIQLDMAVVCTEIVRQRNGNPMIECRTSGGRR
jgi:phosphopantetheine adenylyltransferase